MKVKFTIPGEPKGKGRPRGTRDGHMYTPKDTVYYENLVKTSYFQQCRAKPIDKDVPLDVRITAYFQIPESTSKKRKLLMMARAIRPTKKVDWDNLGKIVCDSLNKIAYHDDAQIVDAQVRKFYSDNPRVVVTIQEARCE